MDNKLSWEKLHTLKCDEKSKQSKQANKFISDTTTTATK